ncbi:MAG TPA: cyanophycinase [Patescibacteria group bacterium]|nr:cyanophycinase [Patescibacteria group bacterium]
MTLIAIGGAEDKTGNMTVLKRVVAESGLEKPRVLVITSATSFPDEAAKKYQEAFGRLGIEPVIHYVTREQAEDVMFAKVAVNADVIFFSGGDQSRLTAMLADTPLLATIMKRESEGAVVAGTSAGAAAMSGMMIAGGRPKKAMKPGGLKIGEGFGFTPDIVFDTHVDYYGRVRRLFGAAANDSRKTVIGLDEDTAIVMRDGKAEVLGAGDVSVLRDGELKRHKAGDRFSL